MQQRVPPHHIRRSSMGHPSLRPHPVAAPPRRRRFDQGGWIRAAIVLVVAFIIAFFGWPALQTEISGRGGWFDTPPFRDPDYRIPDPPPWVNDRPYVEPPPSSGRGRGWTECRPGQGGWNCADGRRR